MKHILGVLKKFSIPILFVIALLFVEAMADLALPDYTANIINIGIQNKGVENTIPKYIDSEMYQLLLDVVLDDSLIVDNYELLSKEEVLNKNKKIWNDEAPKSSLYVLKDLKSEEMNTLVSKINVDVVFALMVRSNSEDVKMQIGLTQDISLYDFYTNLDDSVKLQMKEQFLAFLNNYDNTLISQMGTQLVVSEYQSLGLNIDTYQMNYVVKSGGQMLGIAFLIMIVTIVIGYFSAKIATKFSYLLREKVVNKIMSFSNKEFKEFSLASLITRSTNDIQQIQQLLVMLLRFLIYSPMIGIGAFLKVSGNSMSWVIALALGIIIVLAIFVFTFAMPKFNKVQKLVDKLNLVSREIISGIPVIRAFGTENHEKKRFDIANVDLTKINLFVNRIMSVLMPFMMLVMNGTAILIIWVGAKQVDLGTVQVGTILAFISYTMQIIMSFLILAMVSIMLPRAWVSVKRIAEVLNTKNSVNDPDEALSFPKEIKGELEFREVNFRYPDASEDVIHNINFKATKGTTTAFIGSTGSGKSTIVNLIPRFFDVTSGAIYINGVDIRKVSMHDLRQKIGFVPQQGNLFSGTIESNILFGHDEIDEKQMKRAARIAQAEDFINNKEDGYNSEISQGGTNVSGGQRQRLAIARAVAIDPEFYIFDDSFSALDFKTDVNLRKALKTETKEATILIVAQRISTIMNADQIIVLDKGDCVGIGTHKELLKTCLVYKEIAYSQLKEDEL